MCSGNAPELEEDGSYVGRWMDILRPSYEKLPKGDDAERVRQLEKDSVVTSLENLMTFPHVNSAVESGRLSLHGLWNDIGHGSVEVYDAETNLFTAL